MRTGDLIKGFKTKAEKISINLRRELGLKPHSPLCAFDLANFLDIEISDPLSAGLSVKEANSLMSSNSGWSAMTVDRKTMPKVIIHNIKHSASRQQSNIMHELAHIICEHPFPEIKIINNKPLPLRNYNPQYEAEAEWLGANLQITRKGLVWCGYQKMKTEEISEYYNASIQMVRYRLNITGVKKQLKYF